MKVENINDTFLIKKQLYLTPFRVGVPYHFVTHRLHALPLLK